MSEEELENLLSVVIEDTTIESERLRQYIKDLRNELNSLKEIEQLHQEENGKLRVELEQEKEKNKELEKLVFQFSQERAIILKMPVISKDKLKSFFQDKITYRQFELQQEYKDFKDDIKLNTLQNLKEEILEEK